MHNASTVADISSHMYWSTEVGEVCRGPEDGVGLELELELEWAGGSLCRCTTGSRGCSIMPALAVAGVRWHIASDDVPLFATFGSVFHAIWILVILLTSQSILNMPNQCHHEGRQYIATVTGLLLCFTLGFMVETLLSWEGCKGKNRHIT